MPAIYAQTAKKIKTEADKLIGVNLIKNPGAENITSSNKPVDWKVNGDYDESVSNYGHIAGEWDYGCDKKCGLPDNAGDNYFRAPADIEEGQNHKSLGQTIDITKLKDTLAVKEIDFTFSAQIAGFHCDDNLKCAFGFLKIEFFDAANKSLQSFEAKKYMNEFHRVDESESADSRMHKFEKISLSNIIPSHAASVIVTIGSEQNCSTDDASCAQAYVFFDNLNLYLKKTDKAVSR